MALIWFYNYKENGSLVNRSIWDWARLLRSEATDGVDEEDKSTN